MSDVGGLPTLFVQCADSSLNIESQQRGGTHLAGHAELNLGEPPYELVEQRGIGAVANSGVRSAGDHSPNGLGSVLLAIGAEGVGIDDLALCLSATFVAAFAHGVSVSKGCATVVAE